METMQISKFKATCLAVLDQVARSGRPVLVTRRGVPVARILPPTNPKPGDWLGCMRGTGRIVGDIVSPVTKPGEWEVLR